jgi:S-adenosylmethionine:tRNA ribosyltransferase-isomerase
MNVQPDAEDRLDLFDYQLPKELIAQHPSEQRVASRMMVIHRASGLIEHCQVRDLPQFIQAGDAVVVNDTKVIPARLIGFRTTTRGRWEGLFLKSDDGSGLGDLLCKTRGAMAIGETVTLRDRDGREEQQLELVAKLEGGHAMFRPVPLRPWDELLQACGRVPLPPYIRGGSMVEDDIQRYQTVYARRPGSVAAPTAGLHFTPELVAAIRTAGATFLAATLHVGIGTFRPIQTEDLNQHTMHHEWCDLSEPVVKRLQTTRSEGGRIIAVGTTTVRTLESVASKNNGQLVPWQGETNLFIRPGYQFQATDAIFTNFHLPKSSLLVMISAFATRELIMHAYRVAIENQYRFYSYGDCMLIL